MRLQERKKRCCLASNHLSPLCLTTLHLCPPGNSPSSIPKALLSHSDVCSGLLLKACAAQTVILLQVGNTTALEIKHQFSEKFIGHFPLQSTFYCQGLHSSWIFSLSSLGPELSLPGCPEIISVIPSLPRV